MAEGGPDGTSRTDGLARYSYQGPGNDGHFEPMETNDPCQACEPMDETQNDVVTVDQGPVIDMEGPNVSDAESGVNNSTDEDNLGKSFYPDPRRTRPFMADKGDRLNTFHTWPAQMNQKPEQLAKAGLHYTSDGDIVKCYHCDVLLKNWDPEDDPFVEHALKSPTCEYIGVVKGKDFVRMIQEPAVHAAFFMGISQKSVHKALDAMIANDGPDVDFSGEELMKTVQDIEEAKNGTGRHVNVSEEVKKLTKKNEDLREKQQCKICMDHDREVIFFPCGHIVCCASCGASVQECPICRVRISSMDKFYMS